MLRDKQGNLYFAGDRRISWDFSKAIVAPRPKVSYRDGILYAGTGVAAICDLVTDQFTAPARLHSQPTFQYIHKTFIPCLLTWLRSEGWVAEGERRLNIDGTDSEDYYASIVLGVDSDLYELDLSSSMISADAIDAPYATGCGGPVALGSLLTTEKMKMSIEDKLTLALQVAAQVSPGCDDNVDIVTNKIVSHPNEK